MSDELDRRRPTNEQAAWHKENSAKLDQILENQAQQRETLAGMKVKIDDIFGTDHKPGRVKDLENRVDDLEEAKTKGTTVAGIVGGFLAFIGIDTLKHWLGK